MSPSEQESGRLLLVGRPQSGPLRQMCAQADEDGWAVQVADDGFAAVEAVVQDARLEAVLLQYEAFEPRSDALAKTLSSARPQLPIYLVCPAHLEPEALRMSSQGPTLDYLIGPLSRRDWQTVRRQAVRPRRAEEEQPEKAPAPAAPPGAKEMDHLLDRLGGPIQPLLSMAAAWAGAVLDGRPVRVSWLGDSARHPVDGPPNHDTRRSGTLAEAAPGRTYALRGADGGACGELLVGPGAAGETDDSAGLIELAEGAAGTLGRLLRLRQRMTTFQQMAFTDFLSGARNRRYLMFFLDRLIARAKRENFRITLLMFDIDDFKRYNDAYGHAVGDEIIVDVVRLMRQCSRPHDVVARIGGDEFAVLFWDSGPPRAPGSRHPQEAQAVANRFRRALASHQFRSLGPLASGTLTISGGLASFPRDASDAGRLLAGAGEGLRAAKRSGKNRIYLVGREPVENL